MQDNPAQKIHQQVADDPANGEKSTEGKAVHHNTNQAADCNWYD